MRVLFVLFFNFLQLLLAQIADHFTTSGREVDEMKPFGCQLIVDIIEAQWFPSTSRSKLDLETTNQIYERRDLPLNVLLLSVTAVSGVSWGCFLSITEAARLNTR